MSGNHEDAKEHRVRVELKYCEHCGALWVREGGGGVYCEKCLPKVADLPVPKKSSGRVTLPVQRHSVVDDVRREDTDDDDLEAAGGAA